MTRIPRERLLYLLVLLAALCVRCWDINARSLWFDEAGEYWVATAPLPALAAAVRTGSGDPPLYSVLLHLWLQLGSSAVWIRSLSVLASVAGVAGVMTLARRVSGARAALAAGAMMALLPVDVRYAQEAGQYALMVATLAWNLVALHALWTRPSPRTGALWGVTALAASYTYYGAVLAAGAAFLCAAAEAIARRDRVRVRAGLTGLAVYVLGVIPLAAVILPAQLSRVVASDVSSAGPGGAGGIAKIAHVFNQVIAFQFSGWPYTRVPAAVPVLAALLLLAFAWRARRRRILAWLAAAWLVHALADAANVFPYGFRWGLVLEPLLVAGVACGVTANGRAARMVSFAALACLLAGSALSLPNRSLRDSLYERQRWAWPETEDMRAVLKPWAAKRTPSQATYVYYGAVPAFAYYTRGEAWTRGLAAAWYLDCWHDAAARCGSDNVHFGHWLRGMNDTRRLEDVYTSCGGWPDELWLVFAHMQPNDDRDLVASLVTTGYRIESVYQGEGAAVFLLTRS